jgi:hypothetical protein
MTQNIDLSAMQTPDTAVKRNCEGLKTERGSRGVEQNGNGSKIAIHLD